MRTCYLAPPIGQTLQKCTSIVRFESIYEQAARFKRELPAGLGKSEKRELISTLAVHMVIYITTKLHRRNKKTGRDTYEGSLSVSNRMFAELTSSSVTSIKAARKTDFFKLMVNYVEGENDKSMASYSMNQDELVRAVILFRNGFQLDYKPSNMPVQVGPPVTSKLGAADSCQSVLDQVPVEDGPTASPTWTQSKQLRSKENKAAAGALSPFAGRWGTYPSGLCRDCRLVGAHQCSSSNM